MALGAVGEEAVSDLVSYSTTVLGTRAALWGLCSPHSDSRQETHKQRPMWKKRLNDGILLFLLVLLPYCAPSSMGLFHVLQLVFAQTPLGDNNQVALQNSLHIQYQCIHYVASVCQGLKVFFCAQLSSALWLDDYNSLILSYFSNFACWKKKALPGLTFYWYTEEFMVDSMCPVAGVPKQHCSRSLLIYSNQSFQIYAMLSCS